MGAGYKGGGHGFLGREGLMYGVNRPERGTIGAARPGEKISATYDVI